MSFESHNINDECLLNNSNVIPYLLKFLVCSSMLANPRSNKFFISMWQKGYIMALPVTSKGTSKGNKNKSLQLFLTKISLH